MTGPARLVGLAALTFFAFYLPLRIHFWGGGDEHICLGDIDPLPSLLACDITLNRPFTMLPALVGQLLAPHRIEGFLWLGAALVWLNAVLLDRIVRELVPQIPLLGVAAAALLIVDRSDPARFFVLWASNYYWTAVGLTLLAIWLLLHSQRTGSRGLLSLACGLLAVALLTNEGGYPLAALAVIVVVCRSADPRRWVWSAAWTGMLAILSARFLLFLREHGADSYQATNVADAVRSPGMLFDNFLMHVSTIASCFDAHGGLRRHWPWALAAAATTCLAFGGLVPRRTGLPTRLARHLTIVVVAALALLLGVFPFLHLTHSFRAEFFAAPGKAVLIAAVMTAIAAPLGRFAGVPVMIAVALVTANATGEATSRQLAIRAETPITFESTTHVFRQLHALGRFDPDGVIVVFLDDPGRSPLSIPCSVFMLGKELLGTKILVANDRRSTALPMTPVFGPDRLFLPDGPSKRLWPGTVSYDKVVAVRVASDGTVRLLDRLPSDILPAERTTDRVGIGSLHPGSIDELPYLRYPSWARRPRDVIDPADGLVLGDGWGDLEPHPDGAFRQVDVEAELLVNSLGRSRREIRLDVNADDADRIEALDDDGQVVAAAPLDGHGRVRLDVPTDPERLVRIRLRVVGASTAFQVLAPRRARSAK